MIELPLAADTGFTLRRHVPDRPAVRRHRRLRGGRGDVARARAGVLGVADLPRRSARSRPLAIQLLDIAWLDPIDDAKVVEHVAEVALIFALFSSGLKLDRPLRWREWGSVTRLLALAMPLTMAGDRAVRHPGDGPLAGRGAAAGRDPLPDRSRARGRHRRRPAGRRGGARAELRADRRGGRQRRARRAARADRHLRRRAGRHAAGSASGSWPTSSTRCSAGVAIGAVVGLVGGVERQGPARPRAARARRSTATTRSRPRS